MKFDVGQIAHHLWDGDPVLLLRKATLKETIECGYEGIENTDYACWHVLGLVSGNDWFVLDCDLDEEV